MGELPDDPHDPRRAAVWDSERGDWKPIEEAIDETETE